MPADQTAYNKQNETSQRQTSWYSANPAVPVMPTADSVGNWYSQQNQWSHMATRPQQLLSSLAPAATHAPAAAKGWTPPVQLTQAQPWHTLQPQTNLLLSAGQQGYHQPAGPHLPYLPVPWTDGAPLPALLHPTNSFPRRLSTSSEGLTSRFRDDDCMPGDELDDSGLSMSYDQHPGCDPVLCSLCAPYTGSDAVQPMPRTSMQYATQPHPNLVTFPYPYPANISQYNQQNTAQHMTQVISHDENSVFVSEGSSWKKVNLEKIFP